jgi:hypothetical protein
MRRTSRAAILWLEGGQALAQEGESGFEGVAMTDELDVVVGFLQAGAATLRK